MAITRDQVSSLVAGNATSSGTINLTWPGSLPSTSSQLVVSMWYGPVTFNSFSVSDSGSNHWEKILIADGTNYGVGLGALLFCTTSPKLSIPGGHNITLTYNATGSFNYGSIASSYLLTGNTSAQIQRIFGGEGWTPLASFGETPAISVNAFYAPFYSASLLISVFSQNSGGTSEGLSVSGFSSIGLTQNGSIEQVGGAADFIATDKLTQNALWSWTAGDNVSTRTIICEIPAAFINAPRTTQIDLQSNKRSSVM